MDFFKWPIITDKTIITKEFLDALQDGIIEAIAKAEAALANPSVYNAKTHEEFPSVGDPNVIYKAESERLLYQWNTTELKYEVLLCGRTSEDAEDSEDTGDIDENTQLIDGGDASDPADDLTIVYGGGASGSDEDSLLIDGGDSEGVV